jgi:epoxyqueuosine reductase
VTRQLAHSCRPAAAGSAPADGNAARDDCAMLSHPTPVDVDELTNLGVAAGLDAVGVTVAERFESTRRDLEDRKAAGLHAGMAFTYRNPARSTDPCASLEGARAIVVGARAYRAPRRTAHGGGDQPSDSPAGRVAAYACRDEYTPLRAALRVVAEWLGEHGWKARVVADDNALVDREAARRAGIGWYGKNSNMLLPGKGSWFVLGSVVTTAPLPPTGPPVADGCGACRRCLDGCPTGAIIAPGVVDANRCLAWLLQRAGTFPVEYRAALGDRIYGCDDCQEVCPPNRRGSPRDDAPIGDQADERSSTVSVLEMLHATDDELLERHGRWYIADRNPRWLRRNALLVLGNVGRADDAEVHATIARYRDGDDDVLAEHATWAARQIGAR